VEAREGRVVWWVARDERAAQQARQRAERGTERAHGSNKMLKVSSRLVLINFVLTTMVSFMLSFFKIPKRVLRKIEYYRSRLFWQNDNYKKKYRLAK
jgi:hypothetical protein